VTVRVRDDVFLYANYDALVRTGNTAVQTVSAGLRIRFWMWASGKQRLAAPKWSCDQVGGIARSAYDHAGALEGLNARREMRSSSRRWLLSGSLATVMVSPKSCPFTGCCEARSPRGRLRTCRQARSEPELSIWSMVWLTLSARNSAPWWIRAA